jgi:diaminopimelate epimerase
MLASRDALCNHVVMMVEFTKMQGLGNDFVVFDAIRQSINLTPKQVRQICDRHFGVGCDQLLLVQAPVSGAADFRYRIFNSDGGEVEQCGNGARCFVRFVHDKGLSDKKTISVETSAGLIRISLEDDGQVTVDMGEPVFTPVAIPMLSDSDQPSVKYQLQAGSCVYTIGAVSMGNPHAVLQVDDVDNAAVAEIGPLLEKHAQFPQRVNVGFMQVIDRGQIRLRVYERGAGETLACGTGACAAAVIGIQWGLLDERVRVELPGGELLVRWQGQGTPVWMTGPAQTVYEGRIEL